MVPCSVSIVAVGYFLVAMMAPSVTGLPLRRAKRLMRWACCHYGDMNLWIGLSIARVRSK